MGTLVNSVIILGAALVLRCLEWWRALIAFLLINTPVLHLPVINLTACSPLCLWPTAGATKRSEDNCFHSHLGAHT